MLTLLLRISLIISSLVQTEAITRTPVTPSRYHRIHYGTIFWTLAFHVQTVCDGRFYIQITRCGSIVLSLLISFVLYSARIANQMSQIIQQLNTAIINATTANSYPMNTIQCYIVPVFSPLLPYGLYQRRQCFMYVYLKERNNNIFNYYQVLFFACT